MAVRRFDRLITRVGLNVSAHDDIESSGGTLTLPATTDVLIDDDTIDALTNKTIVDASNTVTCDRLRTTTSDVEYNAVAAPASGEAISASGVGFDGAWVDPSSIAGRDIYVLNETQANGVGPADVAPTATWRKRKLNTIAGPGSDVTLDVSGGATDSQITLTPGDYTIRAWCPATNPGVQSCRLFRPSDATTVINGQSNQADGVVPLFFFPPHDATDDTELVGTLTVAGPGSETFELQHYVALGTGPSGNTYGLPVGAGGGKQEIYSQMWIVRDRSS